MIYKYSANEGSVGIPRFFKNALSLKENSFQCGKEIMNNMK